MRTPEEIFAEAQAKVKDDQICVGAGRFTAAWYQRENPEPEQMLYLIAALLDMVYTDRNGNQTNIVNNGYSLPF